MKNKEELSEKSKEKQESETKGSKLPPKIFFEETAKE
jgi:hypothetical protein